MGLATFTVLTLSQVTTFYLLFLPVLFYSGFDLGETGLFFTRLGLWHLHPRMSAASVWWLALLLILAKAAWIIHYWHPYSWNLPLSLALLVVGVWLTGRRRKAPGFRHGDIRRRMPSCGKLCLW